MTERGPMRQHMDLDTSTRFCPCGASFVLDDRSDLEAWMRKHAGHHNGHLVMHCTDNGARIYGERPPDRTVPISPPA